MKASRYNIFVPLRHGRTLAYNSLSRALAVWEKGEQDSYEFYRDRTSVSFADPALRDLVYGGYLVEEDIDELAILEKHYNAHRFNPQVMTVTIAPTLDCNFGCDYCFQGQDKPIDVMGEDVQNAIVHLVERAAPGIKSLGIAWYGGEPLLRPQIIKSLSDRLIEVCKGHSLKYEAMIVTNGYRLTPDVVKALYERNVKQIQVTLDGTPEYHDRRRILLSGQ
ncbi:MAG: radical SAM protein, partial [Okeania sp. SIO2D1]|nr:radical SAM protein [Okeania sp. SIO2D1]